ncbi:MAG: DUF547 domain-containing protein [Congregibacter sp.]
MQAKTGQTQARQLFQRGTQRRNIKSLRALFAALGAITALFVLAMGGAAAELSVAEKELSVAQRELSAAQTDYGFSHQAWSALLAECVQPTPDGSSTVADYQCFSKQHPALKGYLNSLGQPSAEQLEQWPRDEQLAFLINAYNAWTVELILSAWPDVDSIKELGSFLRSPWKKVFIPLLGDTVSLDEIEHKMIREPGRFDEPRIHFAVNCASVGCPSLRPEAYSAATLDHQLEEQTKQFLSDRSRNRSTANKLEVSSIFKWYRNDFENGWRGAQSLEAFLALYASPLKLDETRAASLRDGSLSVSFLDYDWRLNAPSR